METNTKPYTQATSLPSTSEQELEQDEDGEMSKKEDEPPDSSRGNKPGQQQGIQGEATSIVDDDQHSNGTGAVSYTHLTLPTICSV